MKEELKEMLSQRLFMTHELLKGSSSSNETRQLILESQKSLDRVIEAAIANDKPNVPQPETKKLKEYLVYYKAIGDATTKHHAFTLRSSSFEQAEKDFYMHTGNANVQITKISEITYTPPEL